jgi:lysophospholipase L1-like esterase
MHERYVALGDSSTEGLDDPDGAGGYRGWADRLAERLAAARPGLHYANLAVRGRLVRQVREEQLAPALALRPDLATVFAGVNDVLRPRLDLAAVVADLEHVYGSLREAGATVLTITVPDPSRVMPVARRLAPRIAAYNAAVRQAAERTGVLLVDVGASPVAGDPRLWSEDRLHANSLGHERIAAGLAHALGLPGADASWSEPLPSADRRRPHELLAAEARWVRAHLAPWLVRRLQGRSSGDGVQPKRPELLPWSGSGS